MSMNVFIKCVAINYNLDSCNVLTGGECECIAGNSL